MSNNAPPKTKVDVRHGDRTLVLKPILKSGDISRRDPDAMLAEAIGLAEAIRLDVIENGIINIATPNPATLLGKGNVEKYEHLIKEHDIVLAFVDYALSPIQQRNLETAWNCKVIDRTGLILEIFGERARTREGQLQVELAALEFQRTRLVRSWTHLERQRGGFGFLGGPGESQLELDKRMINTRLLRLKGELQQVIRTRSLQREARIRAEHPTVALVGYTNAGKSTLFNKLTGADVLAKDMLFATLDPTMRGLKLPSNREVVLSDTVGFISDLPTHLVEAFRATLEEVQQADVILHVRDVTHPETKSQKEAVLQVLGDLGINMTDTRLVEVQNKIDLLPADERKHLQDYAKRTTKEALYAPISMDLNAEAAGGTVGVSAKTGEGLARLLDLVEARCAEYSKVYEISLGLSDGAALSWLYAHGKVVDKRDTKTKTHIKVEMEAANYGRFLNKFEQPKSTKTKKV